MILIAEDNALMRRLIRSLVEDLDPNVIECEDGGAAISLFEKHRPDWVLMDVSMNPVNGIAATRAIVGRHSAARVIVVTEHDDEATRAEAFAAGACGFIGKDDLRPLRSLLRDFYATDL